MSSGPWVLLVDDEPAIRAEMAEAIGDAGFHYLTAADVAEARGILADHDEVQIVVTDLRMPGLSGMSLIESEPADNADERDREFVIMTGHGDKEEAIRALRLGVHEFLEKPFDPERLLAAVNRASAVLRDRQQRRMLTEAMRHDLDKQSRLIATLRDQLSHAYAEPLYCLNEASFHRDHETASHTRRIGIYARFIARRIGWSALDEARIDLAARLHDVGKIGIPDAILRKPGPLTTEEWTIMKRHAEIGEAILSGSSGSPEMRLAAEIAGSHHEQWTGTGYPRGLVGEAIPLAARITQIGDVYDALRSPRAYKAPFSHERAVEIMLHGDGRTQPEHFDPGLLAIFESEQRLFNRVFESLQDDRQD